MKRVLTLLVLSASVAAAQTVQRQELSQGDGYINGSGQKLEISVGQAVDNTFSGSGLLYAGYLNTNHAPGTVTDLTAVTGSGEATLDVSWTEVGADGAVGQAATLIVKFSTSPITTQALFEAASTYAILLPAASGGFETQHLTSRLPGPDYYFAVEARDQAKNQSALSNLTSTRTFAVPPADITALTATALPSGGAAKLGFPSPGDDGNTGNLTPGQYRIAYSTDVAPVFSFGQYQVLIATLASPGAPQAPTITGLLGNAVYRFNVFTGDDLPVFSGQSNTPQILTYANPPSALAFLNVSSLAFTAAWGANNNTAATEYFVQVASDPAYSIEVATQDFALANSANFGGLSTETTYYVRVKARNAVLAETAFTDLGPVFLPIGLKAPLGIAISSFDHGLHLQWNPILSGDPLYTRLYRSTAAAGPFAQVAEVPLATVAYDDTGLDNGVTYYYRLSAAKTGAESLLSSSLFGVPRDAVQPQGLAGIEGAMGPTAYTVTWPQNMFNADGTPMNDLKGYRVYRSTSVDGTPAEVAFLPAAGPLQYVDPAGAALAPQFYFVRAVDTSDNSSIESLWVRSPTMNSPALVVSVSPDRSAYTEIPATGVDSLANNGVVLVWTRNPAEENGRIALSYTTRLLRSSGAQADASYSLPNKTRLVFHYFLAPGSYSTSALRPNAVFHEDDLSVFVHNGTEFLKIGGDVDKANQTISVQSRVAGHYIVKQSLRATQFTVLQTAPRRIFTPNGDGVNDSFTIFFENPSDSVISQAKVYDLTGAEVSDLQLGPTGDSLAWNGRDRNGRTARGGIYVYQIQTEGRTWNGTVVLAK